MRDTFERLWIALLATAICTAAMAVLVVGIALAFGTTAHDWYAAGKVTLAEVLVAVGFDEFALTDYRRADGETLQVSRLRLIYGEAWMVRAQLLSMAADRAVLGACAGLVVAILWLWVRRAIWPSLPGRSDAVPRSSEMRARYRPAGLVGAGGPIVGRNRPGGGRKQIRLLVVSEAEFESLLDRAGGIDPAGDAPTGGGWPERSSVRPESLPAPHAKALPLADALEQPGGKADGGNPGPESGGEPRKGLY